MPAARLVQVEVPTGRTWRIKNAGAASADMHAFRPSEFVARIRDAGLRPAKTYALGQAPSRGREVLESLMPPVIFRRVQLLTGLTMGIGVIARR